MNYKIVFKLKNGIEGEVKMTAQNDGDVFVLASKMFASQDAVEFKIDKMVSDFKPQVALNKALDYIEFADDKIESLIDYEKVEKSRLPEEKTDSEEWQKFDDIIDEFENVSDSLKDARKSLQNLLKSIK